MKTVYSSLPFHGKQADRVACLDLSQPPRKIAVLRALPGLGDFLCVVPALRSLRQAFPLAEIVMVGLPGTQFLSQRFSQYLDRWIDFPGYPGLPEQALEPGAIPTFLLQMQQERFDLALQMQGSGGITNPLVMLFGAAINAGCFLPGQFCPDQRYFLPYVAQESEVQRYLRLLEFLGIPTTGSALDFPLLETDLQEFRPLASLLRAPYACVHPGASTPERCWSPQRFAVVAEAIAQKGLQIVLTGSQAEWDRCEQVRQWLRVPSLNLAGQTSLSSLAVVLRRSRLLLCNDTGVSHLAAALKVPSVVIFTQSDPERWAPLDRVRHRAVYQAGGSPAPDQAIAAVRALLEQEKTYVA